MATLAEAGKRLYTVGWSLCAAAWLVSMLIWLAGVVGVITVEPYLRTAWRTVGLINANYPLVPWAVLLIAHWVSTGRWSWRWQW